MSRNRPAILPLLVAFVLAAGLHALLLPLAVGAIGNGPRPAAVADLAVTSLSAPERADAGQAIVVRATITNRGTTDAPQRIDRLILSPDRVIDAADTELAQLQGIGALAPGAQEAPTFTGWPPADADGPYFLIVQTQPTLFSDPESDADPRNNTRATPIFIDGPQAPELAVQSFDAPDRGILNAAVLVEFSVQNLGPGWAHGGWTDRIYLSTDDRFDVNDVELRSFRRSHPLAPEAGYGYERVELHLPKTQPGDYYLIAVADAGQVLDQPSFTAGQFARPITLARSDRPDLAVTRIEAPPQAVVGEQMPFRFTTANFGVVATAPPEGEPNWADGIYLSRDKTINAEDLYLGSAEALRRLDANDRYTNEQASFTIPEGTEPGDWYLAVVADADDQVDEGAFELNNAWAVPLTVVLPREASEEPPLGEPDEPDRLTVAWIEHEVLLEHMARQSRTIQPAIQSIAEPVPNAPDIPDPLPPSQESIARQTAGDPDNPNRQTAEIDQNNAARRPNPADAQDTDTAPRPQDLSRPAPPEREGLAPDNGEMPDRREGIDTPEPDPDTDPTETPRSNPEPQDPQAQPENPGERPIDSPAAPDAPNTERQTDSDTPAERETDTDQTNPDETDSQDPSETMPETDSNTPSETDSQDPGEGDSEGVGEDSNRPRETTPSPSEDDAEQTPGEESDPAQPSEERTPTRRPRDPAEADPTDINQPLRYTEGGVLVGRGIRVNTQRIRRPEAGTRLTAVPRDAAIRIVFDKTGRVFEAELTRSTGYADWDALILESLYRWTAEGPRIEAADPRVEITMEYRFRILSGQ